MREILFRGAQKVDCAKLLIWYEGSLIIETDGYTGEKEYYIQNENGSYLVIPETVGQYAELSDRDCNKIFEGDILRRAYHPEDDVAVLWHDGRFSFKRAKKINKDYPFEAECCVQNAVKRLKIIGNIHDNPELLKEADNE